MREKYEAMGNEMIRSLGFENKKVILFWKAFEEERWLACELHYKCFKKGGLDNEPRRCYNKYNKKREE